MKIHLLSGFLGSGKTTAIQQAVMELLQRGVKTGVITNDQGLQLVDGGWFQLLHIPQWQVVNGCFCCNYQQLEAGIDSMSAAMGTDIIFAESVGSCTDIVATVVKPLLQFHPKAQVTISSFADVRLLQMILNETGNSFDEEVRYIYLKQLEEAVIIVVNKIDLISSQHLELVKARMQQQYGGKIILYQDSLDRDCIHHWLNVVDENHSAKTLCSLDIDYDVYARGEAKLGWVDHSLEIESADGNALQPAEWLMNKIYASVKALRYPIGHIKFLVNNALKISFTSAADPTILLPKAPAGSASLLINMRVQAEPGSLVGLIEAAIGEMKILYGCTVVRGVLAAFKPSYPTPMHRL